MGVLEIVLSAVLCAVVVVSVARIATKAGYSSWWAVVPAAAVAVSYATLDVVHSHARLGALTLHTVTHDARPLLIADGACLGVTVLMLVAFAVSDWPALPAPVAAARPTTSVTVGSAAHPRRRASDRANATTMALQVPARMQIRSLPDLKGQPAGWFASGPLGSGEQTYWDGTRWAGKRYWRNEMWIEEPDSEASLLADPTR